MADADRCVCCGEIIPEGRQVCLRCEKRETRRQASQMRVGDTVFKTISCSLTSSNMGNITLEERILRKGKVIYVHPRGHYYTVAFTLPDGTIRESYRE